MSRVDVRRLVGSRLTSLLLRRFCRVLSIQNRVSCSKRQCYPRPGHQPRRSAPASRSHAQILSFCCCCFWLPRTGLRCRNSRLAAHPHCYGWTAFGRSTRCGPCCRFEFARSQIRALGLKLFHQYWAMVHFACVSFGRNQFLSTAWREPRPAP